LRIWNNPARRPKHWWARPAPCLRRFNFAQGCPIQSKLQNALAARATLGQDFFGGWEPKDADFLKRYLHPLVGQAQPGELIDWLGVRTDLDMHSWLSRPESNIIHVLGLPIPNDLIHAEAIEYVAVITALERAAAHQDGAFTMMELGASYAPWCVASCVLATRMLFSRIHMTAVEASEPSVPHITAHARRNGLTDRPDVTVRPIHAAVHVRDEPVFFPRINVSKDNGAQLALERSDVDYRGLEVAHDRVEGITLTTLCQDLPRVDFIHLDLQGAEEALLADANFLQTLDTRVATLFLATQSRLIEGMALKAISAMGWRLIRERPTTFQQNSRTSDVNGWTTRDGGQLWLNPRFGSLHLDS
jgi:FkbM family methyltransferase